MYFIDHNITSVLKFIRSKPLKIVFYVMPRLLHVRNCSCKHDEQRL